MNFEKIPQELKVLKQWVCWCGDKLPKNPHTGGNAQSNNPSTWGTFEQALEAVARYKFSGVGFMFAPPYFGVDLDKCIDDTDFVDEFVETLQSYTEISRSGNGIHIICKGVLPQGSRRKGNIEMYSEGRYFIMTGNLYNPKYTKIVDCTEKIKPLHAKYLPSIKPAAAPQEFVRLEMNDEEIIRKARECKTGSLFQLLYSGQWEGLYDSQSSADMAFCNILAFWTQRNKEQMDRIFRSSGLMRPKWDRVQSGTTYGNITLEKAISSCTQVYEPKIAQDDTSIALKFFGDTPRASVAVPRNSYDMTDTGNAQRFRDKYKGQIRYNYNRKCWYYWTGKKWQRDEVGAIKSLADTIVNDLKIEAFSCDDEDMQKAKLKFANRTANSAPKSAMITEAQHLEGIPVMPDELDAYSQYLNCQNGVVNLSTGELIPHDPAFLMTKICNAEYDMSGKAPKLWLSFLDDITNGDKELQRYLQKCVGYSLTGDTSEQCVFFLYGMGNNGKSTFLETLANIMGDYAANTQPETLMMKKSDGVNTDIARLKSARLVSSEEPTEGIRLNEGLVKQLSGGGKVTCRFLFGDEFEYEPEFKIWLATNHKPIIRGTDTGIWRRIRLIPFQVNIPKEKVDKMLKYKLSNESAQILRWAVEGCILWQKEGLGLPTVVEAATAEYRTEMDLLSVFIENCVVITNDESEKIPASELYTVYKAWARENKEYEMTNRKFGAEIAKKLPDKKRMGTGMFYIGAHLSEEGDGFVTKNYKFEDFS